MPRSFNRLAAVALKSLPPGKHEDGLGLRLVKIAGDRGKWVLRYSLHGRRREMGLGPWPDVSLKEARESAADQRQLIRRGLDPVTERERRRREAERNLHLLAEVAEDAFDARKAELKRDGGRGPVVLAVEGPRPAEARAGPGGRGRSGDDPRRAGAHLARQARGRAEGRQPAGHRAPARRRPRLRGRPPGRRQGRGPARRPTPRGPEHRGDGLAGFRPSTRP